MDLIGREFGRLTVVGVAERKGYVVCECVCGSRVEVRANSLTKKKCPTRSCGCLRTELLREAGKEKIKIAAKETQEINKRYDTNMAVISMSRPPKHNTSGHTGVSWDYIRQSWVAYLNVHGERHNLGRYKSKEDAILARKQAEDEYFKPIIDKLAQERQGGG